MSDSPTLAFLLGVGLQHLSLFPAQLSSITADEVRIFAGELADT